VAFSFLLRSGELFYDALTAPLVVCSRDKPLFIYIKRKNS